MRYEVERTATHTIVLDDAEMESLRHLIEQGKKWFQTTGHGYLQDRFRHYQINQADIFLKRFGGADDVPSEFLKT